MTIVHGVQILVSPCCGARHVHPRYVSMNFAAFEYWTDGWREGSPMPNDEGLRRCQCGQFLLIKHLVEVDSAESSDLPRMDHVADEALGECISNADSAELEIAARLSLWRSLNHPYRAQYRQHRDAEEAATRVAWEAANPDRRTWWDRLRGVQAPSYSRPANSPITAPTFQVTPEQRQNMERLSDLMVEHECASRPAAGVLLAELYREQGRFDDAAHMMHAVQAQPSDVTSRLIARLIQERRVEPLRYRM